MQKNSQLDDVVSAQELIKRAQDLQPFLKSQAAISEANRSVTDESMQKLKEADLLRVCVPKRWGGLHISANTMGQIARELAKACPSTAWLFCISNSTSWVASLGPDAMQEEVFADGVPVMCSAVNPPGSFVAVDGGYIVNGAWPYSSGCLHSDWGVFGVGGKNAEGQFVPGGNVYVRMSDISIEDTWHVAGLKATGSNTSVAKDLFVPEHMRVPVELAQSHEEGKTHLGEASDYFPFLPHLRTTMLGAFVGMAQGLAEAILENTHKPVIYTTYGSASSSSVVQKEVGEAVAMIDTANLLMETSTALVDSVGLDRREMSYAEQCKNRSQTAFATDLLQKAADKLMYVTGSSSFADKNDAQRFWRDINVAARHAAQVPNVGYEMYGRALLGVEPNIAPHPSFI